MTRAALYRGNSETTGAYPALLDVAGRCNEVYVGSIYLSARLTKRRSRSCRRACAGSSDAIDSCCKARRATRRSGGGAAKRRPRATISCNATRRCRAPSGPCRCTTSASSGSSQIRDAQVRPSSFESLASLERRHAAPGASRQQAARLVRRSDVRASRLGPDHEQFGTVCIPSSAPAHCTPVSTSAASSGHVDPRAAAAVSSCGGSAPATATLCHHRPRQPVRNALRHTSSSVVMPVQRVGRRHPRARRRPLGSRPARTCTSRCACSASRSIPAPFLRPARRGRSSRSVARTLAPRRARRPSRSGSVNGTSTSFEKPTAT